MLIDALTRNFRTKLLWRAKWQAEWQWHQIGDKDLSLHCYCATETSRNTCVQKSATVWCEKEISRSEWSAMYPVALKLHSKIISSLKCSLVQRKRKDKGGARAAIDLFLSVWAFFSSKSSKSLTSYNRASAWELQFCNMINTTGWLDGNCLQSSRSREKCYLGRYKLSHDYMNFLLSSQCSDQYLRWNVSRKAQKIDGKWQASDYNHLLSRNSIQFLVHISLYAQIENKEK